MLCLRDVFHFDCAFSGVFEDFCVEPAYRGTGLARKLVNAALDASRAMGIRSLWGGFADVDVPMHRALGFSAELGNLLAWDA